VEAAPGGPTKEATLRRSTDNLHRRRELAETASGSGIWPSDHGTNELIIENLDRAARSRSVLSQLAASRTHRARRLR
jgi:hypothetical protein